MTLKRFKEHVLAFEDASAQGADTETHQDRLIRFFEDRSIPPRVHARAAGWLMRRVISKRRRMVQEADDESGIRLLLRRFGGLQ